MAAAVLTVQTTWEGPPASGTGLIRVGSGAAGELAVTCGSRIARADGKTSPEELVAAPHSACYALALRLGEQQAAPEQLAVPATVTLDEAGGVPTIVSSHVGFAQPGYPGWAKPASARWPVRPASCARCPGCSPGRRSPSTPGWNPWHDHRRGSGAPAGRRSFAGGRAGFLRRPSGSAAWSPSS